jgi:hypothetical protein
LEFRRDEALVSATPPCGSGKKKKKEYVTAIQCGFQQQFQRREVPSHNTLLSWALKWHQEGSVMDSKPQGHPLLARKPDVEQVRDTMLQSLHRSVWQQAFTLHLHECSIL